MLFITAFVFSDLVDGAMARKTGRSSTFGSFWDSTLDRIADGAIFAGFALYYAGPGDSTGSTCALSLVCLVMGSVVSYARAKAESLGLDARGGLAERPDRLVLILVATGLGAILDLPVAHRGRAVDPRRRGHRHRRSTGCGRCTARPSPATPSATPPAGASPDSPVTGRGRPPYDPGMDATARREPPARPRDRDHRHHRASSAAWPRCSRAA